MKLNIVRHILFCLAVINILSACGGGGGGGEKSSNSVSTKPQVTLETSKGTIVLELRPDKTPLTVSNFLQYVNDSFYNNSIFHRILRPTATSSLRLIQGGGFSAYSSQTLVSRAPIAFEGYSTTGLGNVIGTIAMARSTDRNSATSQFFINTINNTALNKAGGGYAVFGSVIKGMNVVRTINAVATDINSKPTTKIILTSAKETTPITETIPPMPSGLTISGGVKKIELSWNDIPEATSYNVYYSTQSGVTTTTGTKASNLAPPVSQSGLAPNTAHYYIVTAVNRVGESVPSPEVSTTTSP